MPTNITPAANWDTVIPTPNDGEGVTAASISAGPVQPLANREQYLYSQVNTVVVPRLRNCPGIATLQAQTGMGHTDQRHVMGKGVYLFDSGSAVAEDLPWIVAPTVGTGRWIHELHLVRAANLATLSGGRVVQLPANANVAPFSFKSTPLVGSVLLDDVYGTVSTTTYTTFAAATATSVATSIKAGDLLKISAHGRITGASIGLARLFVTDDAAVTVLTECWSRCEAGAALYTEFHWTALYTAIAGADRTVSVGIEGRTTNAANPLSLMKPFNILVEVIRP